MSRRIRSVCLCLTLTISTLWSNPASAESGQRARHVIVIGVDGLSADGVRKAQMPNLHTMMEQGSWTLSARGVLPTSSSANWASILTGVGPEQHGVTSNDWRVSEFNFPTAVIGSGNFYPSIFQLLADQRPDWEVGSIYEWEGFANLYDRRFVDHDAHGASEEEATKLAVDYIRSKKPDFLFVHLDNVDHAGHGEGHGTPQYYAAVAQADKMIGRIRQATIDAGIADETVILVTSDHGGVGKGHGGETLAELEIPWVVYGKGVNPGARLDLPINTYDTTATVAWLLGVEPPYAWLGRPVRSVLRGEAAPAQAYRVSSSYAAPVIGPEGEGNVPSGGLFVKGPAQMTIRKPNSVGEVRYTLDGTPPAATSPLYTGPIEIKHSTVVRASLFVEGRAVSAPATGYFRILEPNGGTERGVSYQVYLLPQDTVRLPDFARLKSVAFGTSYELSIDGLSLPRRDNVAVVFEGFIHIAKAGNYRFSLASDDGSKLYINGKAVVDNDGDHGVITASGSTRLESGKQAIRVEYFNGGGGAWLGAYFEGPGIARQFIDPNLLTPR